MKNIYITLLICMVFVAELTAQSLGANYQALILNADSYNSNSMTFNYMPNKEMIVRFTLKGSNGLEYQEEHVARTDENGILNVIFGQGIPTDDSPIHDRNKAFRELEWQGSVKLLKTEICVNRDLMTFIEIDNQTQYYVPFAKHRTISAEGYMQIDGRTNLNQSLTVNNKAKTELTGTLTVDKESALKEVTANAEVTVEDYFSVTNTEEGYAIVMDTLTSEHAGILVNINSDANKNINFVSFFDSKGNLKGCIRGNSYDDVWTDREYLYNFVYYIAKNILQGFCIALAATQVATSAVMTFGMKVKWAKLAIEIVNMAALITETVLYNVYAFEDLGVAYVTSNGDYAEWFERRDQSEIIMKGEVVGVFGDKISKTTDGAQRIMVVSHNPAVVGNYPENFEKSITGQNVGFLGQVPVWTIGVVEPGDYIVAYESGSGLATAVKPENLSLEMSDKIIGKALTGSKYEGNKLINTLIGTRDNSEQIFAKRSGEAIEQLNSGMETIDAKMQLRHSMLQELIPDLEKQIQKEQNKPVSSVQ